VLEEVFFVHAGSKIRPYFWVVEVREILQAVGRLRWRLGKPVEGLLIGAYRSTLRGEGIEFKDARPYQPGEPWRRIHWALSARRGEPYLWLATEERQLTCTIALDLSDSMRVYPEKFRQAAITGATIALTALKVGDKVQWLGFTDSVAFFSPPRRSESFTWGAFQELLNFQPTERRTRLKPLLEFYGQTPNRRGLLVLLTDGFWQDGVEVASLLRAVARKHFVLLLYIRHPREAMAIPFGRLPYREVETGMPGIAAKLLRPISFPQPSLRQALIQTQDNPWAVLVRVLGSAPL